MPADKSISHRAAIIAAMASEPARVRNYLAAADTSSTLAAVRKLGAIVERRDGELVIRGCGLRNAMPPGEPIDVGNAGTLMRLLPGWLSFQQGASFELDGDESIRRRPVDRIAEPLERMGARIEAREGRFPPFTVHGEALTGIDYELPVASGQVKSCVLLAGLVTDATTVAEPVPTRDHTERMLRPPAPRSHASATGPAAGSAPRSATPTSSSSGEVDVPGDQSSAAFLIAAGVLVRGSRLVLERVGVNWTRAGFLRILERMGAIVLADIEPPGTFDPREPVADIDVAQRPDRGDHGRAPRRCRSRSTSCRWWRCSGASPMGTRSSAAPASCGSRSRTGSRPSSTACAGSAPRSRRSADGFVVTGTGRLRGGRLDSHGDHRLALLGAVAGLASEEGVEVVGMEAADVSYRGSRRMSRS